MNPFRAALAQADLDLDVQMGETVMVVPMSKGDFGGSPDPDRATFDIAALVTQQDPSATQINSLHARVSYEEITVEIRRALLGSRRIKKDDEILLLEHPASLRLRVIRVERDDPERMSLICGPLSDA